MIPKNLSQREDGGAANIAQIKFARETMNERLRTLRGEIAKDSGTSGKDGI
jgi:hypothetical protein